jgi:hypothetical protein
MKLLPSFNKTIASNYETGDLHDLDMDVISCKLFTILLCMPSFMPHGVHISHCNSDSVLERKAFTPALRRQMCMENVFTGDGGQSELCFPLNSRTMALGTLTASMPAGIRLAFSMRRHVRLSPTVPEQQSDSQRRRLLNW